MMRRTASWLLALALLPLAAQGYDEGFDYQRIAPPLPTDTPGKVEVVELFWYGCPHCFRFEPIVERWLESKPDDVAFKRVPAIFRDSWAPLARAYYTAEALGVLDRLHMALFEAIHLKRRNLNSEGALRTFFQEHGVSGEDFDRTYRSFAVESKVRRAMDLTRRYGINGVPSMVVDGKFRTDGTLAGGLDEVPKIVDHLVATEAGTRAAASATP
jgi:thiol:disulfide interchange protein DsbA